MNRNPEFWTVDFETEAITYATSWRPPKPVSVAVMAPDGHTDFWSWGHPDSNPLRRAEAYELLRMIWNGRLPVAFHGAAFDMAVAQAHFDLPWLPPTRVHDSLVLAYLYNPLLPSLALKPLAEELLQMKPEERDAVRDWLVANKYVGAKQRNWGAFICKAPASIVGPYAIGDVRRTYGLVDKLLPLIAANKMMDAYRRELELQPILHKMTRHGVRIARDQLCADYAQTAMTLTRADEQIRIDLGVPSLNIDANEDLADALDAAKKVNGWGRTPSGKRMTARDSLIQNLNDPALAHLLAYRGELQTICNTFMGPWVEQSETDSRLHPEWNAVRGTAASGFGGTRTGRLSSSKPNFQNIPTEFPMQPPAGWPPLPRMRNYVLPEEGEVYVSADYNSQEIRILGHFAGGAIERIYTNDPDADVHTVVQMMVEKETGKVLPRKAIKIIIFSLIYGAGTASIAKRLDVSDEDAAKFIVAILDVLDGVRDIKEDITEIGNVNVDKARAGNKKDFVRTWGGRVLRAPFDKFKRRRGYALLNYLIQGTAADQTKQAMITYDEIAVGRTLATVHDELCVSMPVENLKRECDLLEAAMTAAKFDLPFRVTVKTGPNWGEVK